MPNFIHSLDAANVHLVLVSMSDRSLPVYIILDCFASTANNLNKNIKLVKAVFINILLLRRRLLSKKKLHQHYVAAIISETDYYQPIGLT